jgi:hypothetical protein
MKTPSSLVVAALTAGVVATLPMSARATCTQIIYAERAISTGAIAQLLGRNTSIDAFQWFGNTTNAQFADLIFSAVAVRNRVMVTGDATVCPTTGTQRFVGNIQRLVLSP